MSACDSCGSPQVEFTCGHCHLFHFCSEECSDDIAEEHHAVCYDAKSDDTEYLGALLSCIGQPHSPDVDIAHELIAEYLAIQDFTPSALEHIALGRKTTTTRKRRVKKTRAPRVRKSRVKTVNKARRKARVRKARRAPRAPRVPRSGRSGPPQSVVVGPTGYGRANIPRPMITPTVRPPAAPTPQPYRAAPQQQQEPSRQPSRQPNDNGYDTE